MSESFLDGKVTLHRGDCLEVLSLLEADSIDSCVTDPPYHLTSIVKRFGNEARTNMSQPADKDLSKVNAGAFRRLSKGFMGKQWDGGDIAFRPEIWAQVYRVLKPGAHLLAFSGTRTYHRMACAIEDAGFEIRDQIGWCYGSGFPKSQDISKAIERMNTSPGEYDVTEPGPVAIQWQGWGTALKPAWEPICLARKPLSESSIAANVLKHGTGAINIDGCRIASDGAHKRPFQPTNNGRNVYGAQTGFEPTNAEGRWPANLIHDGSEEVLAGFPEPHGAGAACENKWPRAENKHVYGKANQGMVGARFGDSGSAARFFYTAKADADDRLGSRHPTVKPLDLIQYLTRLVTPRGGIVLDPFAGTGTTGEAAFREAFRAILIERESEYQADIVKRMGLCLAGPEQRRAASVKQIPPDDLPIFGGAA